MTPRTAICSVLAFCLGITVTARADAGHSVHGIVITTDGAVAPKFTVVIKETGNAPTLARRLHFKNGEFTVDGLAARKYEFHVSATELVGGRLDFDFTADDRPVVYPIVILHSFRNEVDSLGMDQYTVSVNTLERKIPRAALSSYRKAAEMHREGKLAEAILAYGAALRAYPNFVDALTDMGAIFLLYNRPVPALMFLRRAQSQERRNPVINLDIANALMQSGDYKAAMESLRAVIHDEPQTAVAYYCQAIIHHRDKNYVEAENSLRHAVALEPRLLEAWLLLVDIQIEQHQYGDARDTVRQFDQAIDNRTVTAFLAHQLSTSGN
jgi:tetratricopeptide (TPR) repeat protein